MSSNFALQVNQINEKLAWSSMPNPMSWDYHKRLWNFEKKKCRLFQHYFIAIGLVPTVYGIYSYHLIENVLNPGKLTKFQQMASLMAMSVATYIVIAELLIFRFGKLITKIASDGFRFESNIQGKHWDNNFNEQWNLRQDDTDNLTSRSYMIIIRLCSLWVIAVIEGHAIQTLLNCIVGMISVVHNILYLIRRLPLNGGALNFYSHFRISFEIVADFQNSITSLLLSALFMAFILFTVVAVNGWSVLPTYMSIGVICVSLGTLFVILFTLRPTAITVGCIGIVDRDIKANYLSNMFDNTIAFILAADEIFGQLMTVMGLWAALKCWGYLPTLITIAAVFLSITLVMLELLVIPAMAKIRTESNMILTKNDVFYYGLKGRRKLPYLKWAAQRQIEFPCGDLFVIKESTCSNYFLEMVKKVVDAVLLIEP
ncbi:unnamed protein product [Orchesella dallaii]|uniref:Uncharacterized protein n=1 Tax=Orchesella dallaii TaxID=48710 RepID=A0ABP1RJZ0_9HEXA